MRLLFVPILAVMGREFGPMLRAEQTRARGEATGGEVAVESETQHEDVSPAEARWYNAAIPILVTLAVVLWLLIVTGTDSLGDDAAAASLRDIFGAADSSLALQYGSLAGLAVVALLCRMQGILSGSEIASAAGKGAKVVLPAIAILWCASSLSRQTGSKSVEGEASKTFEHQDHRLYTGDYLSKLVLPEDAAAEKDSLTVRLLPTVIFVLAAVLAFATGTSFGTMGILMPMVIGLVGPLLAGAGSPIDPSDPVLLASIASVLAGAVFGDHCSPISDTTILSFASVQL